MDPDCQMLMRNIFPSTNKQIKSYSLDVTYKLYTTV